MTTHDMDKGDGLMRLVRQTAEGLTELVRQHLTLARLELARDLVTAAKRARVIAVLALLAAVGYALTMAGVAVVFGGDHRLGIAFLAVGLAHVGAAGIGALWVSNRTRGTQIMNASVDEAARSFATLGSAGAATTMEKTRAV